MGSCFLLSLMNGEVVSTSLAYTPTFSRCGLCAAGCGGHEGGGGGESV